MDRNYLKGEVGDQINAILAGSAFNFKSWMRKKLERLILVIKIVKIWWLKQVIIELMRLRGDLRVDKFKESQTLF